MNRRGFMSSILALGMAPAVITSGVLMPIKVLAEATEEEVIEYGMCAELSYPVNFVLMRALLEAARKKLPYFNEVMGSGVIVPSSSDTVKFGVRMT